MKVVIAAGGRGSRLGAMTDELPKALVEISGRPILYRLMARFAAQGLTDFQILTGYRGAQIADFARSIEEDWNISVVDTGLETGNAGRLLHVESVLNAPFILSWCDFLSDLNVQSMRALHQEQSPAVTMTVTHPPPRFGEVLLSGDRVVNYIEKPDQSGWISAGCFVVEPEVLELIDSPSLSWEYDVLPRLVAEGAVGAYRHEGFWQCMDNAADHEVLTSTVK